MTIHENKIGPFFGEIRFRQLMELPPTTPLVQKISEWARVRFDLIGHISRGGESGIVVAEVTDSYLREAERLWKEVPEDVQAILQVIGF